MIILVNPQLDILKVKQSFNIKLGKFYKPIFIESKETNKVKLLTQSEDNLMQFELDILIDWIKHELGRN